jgi:hypothetical protein
MLEFQSVTAVVRGMQKQKDLFWMPTIGIFCFLETHLGDVTTLPLFMLYRARFKIEVDIVPLCGGRFVNNVVITEVVGATLGFSTKPDVHQGGKRR